MLPSPWKALLYSRQAAIANDVQEPPDANELVYTRPDLMGDLAPCAPTAPAPQDDFWAIDSHANKKTYKFLFHELVMGGGGALGADNFSVRQNATILNELPSDVLQKHENRSAASQVHAHVSVCDALCHSFAVQLVVLSFPLCYLSSGVWP